MFQRKAILNGPYIKKNIKMKKGHKSLHSTVVVHYPKKG